MCLCVIDDDECSGNPCRGAPCVDSIKLYLCQCPASRTGSVCERRNYYRDQARIRREMHLRRIWVEMCMGLGIPMGMGVPWEFHANETRIKWNVGMGMGMGINQDGNGNDRYSHRNRFPSTALTLLTASSRGETVNTDDTCLSFFSIMFFYTNRTRTDETEST